jgi:mannose-6-phosphate isomerase-like protein (cupin superfamily)
VDERAVDRERVASEWRARGYSCDLFVDPPGRCWEGFVHETDELVVVCEGEMEFEIAGEMTRPRIGEELRVPAGAVHSARNIGTTTARWLYGYARYR